MMTPNLLERLGSLIQRKQPQAPSPAPAEAPAPPPAAAPGPTAEPVGPSAAPIAAEGGQPAPASVAAGGGQINTTAVLADPIIAGVTQELAGETEDEQLQAEQHTAWAAYDFERCIVIFSRLLELHPDDPDYKEKLVASYFNRGKQYEAEGNEQRATQLYYSALALDPGFGPAQEAAQELLGRSESV
jgi:hypothetical protein